MGGIDAVQQKKVTMGKAVFISNLKQKEKELSEEEKIAKRRHWRISIRVLHCSGALHVIVKDVISEEPKMCKDQIGKVVEINNWTAF